MGILLPPPPGSNKAAAAAAAYTANPTPSSVYHQNSNVAASKTNATNVDNLLLDFDPMTSQNK